MNDQTRLRLIALLNALEEGLLNDSQETELVELLKSSDEAQQYYLQFQMLSAGLSDFACDGVLPADEPTALPEASTIQFTASDKLTKQKYAAAFSYVLRHTFTPRRVGIIATAAALLLGVVLTLVLLGGPDEGDPIAEQVPPTIDDPVIESLPVVATLTAEHDAVWANSAEGALAPGSTLRPGDRLTLTAGFAEITTNQGAVAIFEAPATVELLDNDNALRLHAGKLVGICETEASQGFLVRTPHMDITDLGTRFGVDASIDEATEVHVYEGEVVCNANVPAVVPIHLTAGQSAAALHGSDTITRIAYDPFRFSAIKPTIFNASGTGLGLAEGDADPIYRVVRLNGKAPAESISLKVIDKFQDIQPNDPARVQWIGLYPKELPEGFEPVALYTVEVELLIDERADLDQAALNMTGHFDSELAAMRINDRAVSLPELGKVNVVDVLEFADNAQQLGLKHGPNTIQFDIRNLNVNSLVAMHLRWKLKAAHADTP